MKPIILPRISDQKPLVSVVSITYNHEPYIRDCLEGFLMQKTDFPVEVIIHDDASTDHTADIIREYYEKHPDLFHVIIERENQYSQHKPIMMPLYEQAQGKYIAVCEGDDYWTDPLKLQKQFDFMESNQKFSLCFHRVKELEEAKTRMHLRQKSGIVQDKDIFPIWRIPTCSVFFKREVCVEYKMKLERCKGANSGDIVLFLTACNYGMLYGLEDEMGIYRRHFNGATFTFNKKGFGWDLHHLCTIKRAFPNIRENANKFIVFSLYRYYILGGDIKEKKKALKRLKYYSVKYHIMAFHYAIITLLVKFIELLSMLLIVYSFGGNTLPLRLA